MRNIFITIALSLFLFGCSQSHDTLNINGIKYKVDGSLEKGIGKCFYDNGNVRATVEIANGTLNGKYLEYYEDFKVKKECYYKEGQTDGPLKMYYNNGRLFRQSSYKKGFLDGSLTEYNPDGSKTIEAKYKNGDMLSLTEYKRGETLSYHLEVKVTGNKFMSETTYILSVTPAPKLAEFYLKRGNDNYLLEGNTYTTHQVQSGPMVFVAKGISQYDIPFMLTAKK